MQLTLLKGYPDFVGKRATFVGYGSGPSSYDATNGDVVSLPLPNYYIDALNAGATNTVSGTYFVRPQPAGVGARQAWKLFWFSANGTAVGAATDLSAEQVQFGGSCGQY